MKEIATTKSGHQAETRAAKRTYQRPILKSFGKVHLLTQGAGGTKGDGQLGMTRSG